MSVPIEDAERKAGQIVAKPKVTGIRRLDFGPVGDEQEGIRLGFRDASMQAISPEGQRLYLWVTQPSVVLWRGDQYNPIINREDISRLKPKLKESVVERVISLRESGRI